MENDRSLHQQSATSHFFATITFKRDDSQQKEEGESRQRPSYFTTQGPDSSWSSICHAERQTGRLLVIYEHLDQSQHVTRMTLTCCGRSFAFLCIRGSLTIHVTHTGGNLTRSSWSKGKRTIPHIRINTF